MLMFKEGVIIMEKTKYVTLRCTGEKEWDYVCDTLQKAIGSLNGIGISMGLATLTKLDNDFTILLYEGGAYTRIIKGLVVLPFNLSASNFEESFEALLKDIFAPFQEDIGVPCSFIQVKQSKYTKGFYSVNLCLCLERGSYGQAFLALDNICDSSKKVESTVFKCS